LGLVVAGGFVAACQAGFWGKFSKNVDEWEEMGESVGTWGEFPKENGKWTTVVRSSFAGNILAG
ncbi:MAG: hypothetical protein LUD52_02475, partial [Opitutae bacterium]|nr:hypothetical protein [Opitutae bacterium]